MTEQNEVEALKKERASLKRKVSNLKAALRGVMNSLSHLPMDSEDFIGEDVAKKVRAALK